jgi:hypothetical protein
LFDCQVVAVWGCRPRELQLLSSHSIDDLASTLLPLGTRSFTLFLGLRPGLFSLGTLLRALCPLSRCCHLPLLVSYLPGAACSVSGRLLLRARLAFLAGFVATFSPLLFSLFALCTDLLLLLSVL